MPYAIRLHQYGGPDVLQWEEYDPGSPGPGELRLRQHAAGVNFLDIYHRAGTHHTNLKLPAIPGVEAIGTVEAVGEGVANFSEGDRVAYPLTSGSYAEVRLIPAINCITMPDDISDEVVASTFMKALTVGHLLHNVTKLKAGDVILCHAAAGGIGLIACQWSKFLGATVIGTVGSEKKSKVALAHGCDHCIDYTRESVAERVHEVTNGHLCNAVLDGVGHHTWMDSLKCLRPFGTCATFGLASGPLPSFGFADIPSEGFVTRATVRSVAYDRPMFEQATATYIEALRAGAFTPHIHRSYMLKDAATAHDALESRQTTGSLILKMSE